MKADVLDLNGKKIKEIGLPGCFNEEIREDMIKRAFEAEISEKRQPYGSFPDAGKLVSASGKIKHARRKWKTAYGYGISRVPRKIMSRRGTRFYWKGAFASGTVGGREAHPPKVYKVWLKKINKKERAKAIRSAISATANPASVEKRYSINNFEKIRLPLVVENRIEDVKKAKEIKKILENMLRQVSDSFMRVAFRERKVRAGKGKGRNRYYKKARGILIVTSKGIDAIKSLGGAGVDAVSVGKLSISQLAPAGVPGRITIYTENAVKEMEKIERLK